MDETEVNTCTNNNNNNNNNNNQESTITSDNDDSKLPGIDEMCVDNTSEIQCITDTTDSLEKAQSINEECTITRQLCQEKEEDSSLVEENNNAQSPDKQMDNQCDNQQKITDNIDFSMHHLIVTDSNEAVIDMPHDSNINIIDNKGDNNKNYSIAVTERSHSGILDTLDEINYKLDLEGTTDNDVKDDCDEEAHTLDTLEHSDTCQPHTTVQEFVPSSDNTNEIVEQPNKQVEIATTCSEYMDPSTNDKQPTAIELNEQLNENDKGPVKGELSLNVEASESVEQDLDMNSVVDLVSDSVVQQEPQHEYNIFQSNNDESDELKNYENVTLQSDYITTESKILINPDDPNEFYVTNLPREQSATSLLASETEGYYQQIEVEQGAIGDDVVDNIATMTETEQPSPLFNSSENEIVTHNELVEMAIDDVKSHLAEASLQEDRYEIDHQNNNMDDSHTYEYVVPKKLDEPLNNMLVNENIQNMNDTNQVSNDIDAASLNSEGMTNDPKADFDKRYAQLTAKYLPNYRENCGYDTKRKTETLGRYDNRSYTMNQNRWSGILDGKYHKRKAVTLERNASRRRRRVCPKPAVNDDYLYPDSVTPSKVDRGISVRSLEQGIPEGKYNVPYIDDDAFIPKKSKESNNEDHNIVVNGDDSDDESVLMFDDSYWSWDPNPNYFNKLDLTHTADTNECTVTPEIKIKNKSALKIDAQSSKPQNQKVFRLLCGLCNRRRQTTQK